MPVGQFGDFATARSAFQEALLDQEGFVDLFDGAGIFADGSGDGGEAHRATLELIDDGQQDTIVDQVEAISVDIECFEGSASDGEVDMSRTSHHCEISHTAQQRVGDTRSAAAAECYLAGGIIIDADAQKPRRSLHDGQQEGMIVIFQVTLYAEASSQRRCQTPRPGRGPHQREGSDGELHRLRSRALVQEDVDAEILHS